MTDQALIDELSSAKYLPALAVARAVAEPDLVSGPILEVLQIAADSASLGEREANLLFWGIHILAAARDPRGLVPLLRLLQSRSNEFDWLIDDTMETLDRIVVGMFEGDFAALSKLILDRGVDDFVQGNLLHAATFLVGEGRVDPTDMQTLLERFDDEREAPPDSFAWHGWQQAIALLGLGSLTPRVEAAWRNGRIDKQLADRTWFWKALRAAQSAPDDKERFREASEGYFGNIVADLAQFVEPAQDEDAHDQTPLFSPMTPVVNPMRHVGRNDPCPCGSGKKAKKCCLAT